MKSLSPTMIALLKQDGIGALADFWELTRTDGTVLKFTNWSSDVGPYLTAPGWSRSAMQAKVDLSTPNEEITGIAIDAYVNEDDIRAGKYDGAQVSHFYAIPTDANFLTYGRIYMPVHYLSEVRLEDGIYILEARGFSYLLQQNLIDLFGPLCRADFADKNGANLCKLDPAGFTMHATVVAPGSVFSSGPNFFTFTQTGGVPFESRFQWGTIKWLTGKNLGVVSEICSVDTNALSVTLYMAAPFAIQAGDLFDAVMGCAKTNVACKSYGNIANFRGEPFIPGMNLIFDYGTSA